MQWLMHAVRGQKAVPRSVSSADRLNVTVYAQERCDKYGYIGCRWNIDTNEMCSVQDVFCPITHRWCDVLAASFLPRDIWSLQPAVARSRSIDRLGIQNH